MLRNSVPELIFTSVCSRTRLLVPALGSRIGIFYFRGSGTDLQFRNWVPGSRSGFPTAWFQNWVPDGLVPELGSVPSSGTRIRIWVPGKGSRVEPIIFMYLLITLLRFSSLCYPLYETLDNINFSYGPIANFKCFELHKV